MVGGLSWTGSVFLTWRSDGVLSRSTLMDAARFIRRGVVDGILPPQAAPLLLAPAVVGLALVALAGIGGRRAAWARGVIAVVGVAAVVVLLDRVGGRRDQWAVGADVALLGTAAVAATFVAETMWRPIARKWPRGPVRGH